MTCPHRLGTLESGVHQEGEDAVGKSLQGIWEPFVLLTVLLPSQIQFIFKCSEEKTQNIAQAPGVPSDPKSYPFASWL